VHNVAGHGLIRAYDDGYSSAVQCGNGFQRNGKPSSTRVCSSWAGSDVLKLGGRCWSDFCGARLKGCQGLSARSLEHFKHCQR
jgi:hypothetical protein